MVKFVRLACLMCAASVYPEPGSNSLVFLAFANPNSAVSIFVRIFSIYIEYYLKNSSSISLHNLFIKTDISTLLYKSFLIFINLIESFFKLFKLLAFFG